jgi:hypothetical protein
MITNLALMQGKNLAFSASFGKAAGIGFAKMPEPFASNLFLETVAKVKKITRNFYGSFGLLLDIFYRINLRCRVEMNCWNVVGYRRYCLFLKTFWNYY